MSNVANSRGLTAVIELVIFIALALGLKELMDPWFWAYAGPVSLISTLLLLTLYVRGRGEGWSSMGLRSLPSLKSKLLVMPQAILIFVTVVVTLVLLTKGLAALGFTFMTAPIEGEEERWGDIEDNLKLYLILIGISWVSAGFGEEMFFRGFVMTRLLSFLGNSKLALVLAVVLSAAFFGSVHFYYQGLAGFVNAGVIGAIFGSYFLLYKRNLWPLILTHGSLNSIAFTGGFLGLPG